MNPGKGPAPDRMSFDASIHDMSEVDAVTIET
jgi:hypothetical protein